MNRSVAITVAVDFIINANLIHFEQHWAAVHTAVPLKTSDHISAGQHLSCIIYIFMDIVNILVLTWANN